MTKVGEPRQPNLFSLRRECMHWEETGVNIDDDFDLEEHGLCIRPWGESRTKNILSSLMQAISVVLVFVIGRKETL